MRLSLVVLFGLVGLAVPGRSQGPAPTGPPPPIAELKLPGGAHGLAGFGDAYLVTSDRNLVLVDKDCKRARTVATEKSFLLHVAVAPDGKHVAYGCGENATGGVVRVLDYQFRVVHTLTTPADTCVRSLAFDPKGATLAVTALSQTGGGHKTVYYDVATGKQAHLPDRLCNDIVTVAYMADGKHLLLATADGPVRVVATDTNEDVGVLEHADRVQHLALSADGRYLACYGLFNDIFLWDLPARKLLRQLSGHTESVQSVAVDGEAGLVASGSFDKSVRVWAISTGELVWERADAHPNGPSYVALSGSGKAVVSFGVNEDVVRVWDLPKKDSAPKGGRR